MYPTERSIEFSTDILPSIKYTALIPISGRVIVLFKRYYPLKYLRKRFPHD